MLTHQTGRVLLVGSHFAVYLNGSLHDDLDDFMVVQGVFQSVSQDNDKWQRIPDLVWTTARTNGEHTTDLVQHP